MPAPLIAYGIMAGLQLMGGIQSGEAIRMNARVRRQIDDMNMEAAELDAWEAERDGNEKMARYDQTIDQVIGDQRVAYASQGVDVNYGSAAEVQKDSKLIGMMNRLEIKRQARERVRGFKREKLNILLGSQMKDIQDTLDAGTAERTGVLNAATTMLSGYSANYSGKNTPKPETKPKVEKASAPLRSRKMFIEDYDEGLV